MRAAPSAGPRTLTGLIRYFVKLGSSGFGGPIALVGYMQRDLVEQRGWFTKTEYRQGLALAHGERLCAEAIASSRCAWWRASGLAEEDRLAP